VCLRTGVAPKDLGAYVQAQDAALDSGAFLADVAGGLVYAVSTPSNTEQARAWVDALRKPALNAGGYAVVLNEPESLRGALDLWGYQPQTLELMRSLKARWDPAGILNPGVFVA
jgi:glycolate oxidase FAD binding subunit